jgi:glycerol kinase
LACGMWRSPAELARLRGPGQIFKPRMAATERDELIRGWRDAVGRVLSKPVPAGTRRGRA